MNKVTIAFSNNIAIGSKIIALSESRKFSHALVIFDLEGVEVVFQASHGMVNMVSLEHFLLTNTIDVSYVYELSNELAKKVKLYAISKLGIPYGTIQLIYIGLMKLLNIKTLPKRIYNLITNKDAEEICSELVSSVVMLIDPKVDFSEVQLDLITPSDLDTKLLNEGSVPRQMHG